MSEPEIARRCLACGASTRERASFCPECGQELRQNSAESDVGLPNAGNGILVGAPDMAEPTAGVALPLEELTEEAGPSGTPRNAEALSDGNVPVSENPADSDQTETVSTSQPEVKRGRVRSYGSPPRQAAAQGAQEKIHRAKVAARELEGDMLHKVEKIRKMSTVVLDEAAYDPSLRFLLVAGALFALFLIIVLLNNLIR